MTLAVPNGRDYIVGMSIAEAGSLAGLILAVAWFMGPRLRRRFTKVRPFCADYDIKEPWWMN